MIAIIGAMSEEVSALKELIVNLEEKVINNFTYYVGDIANKKVVLTQSGVGKTLSAMTTTALLMNFEVSKVINIGSAGSLVERLNIGDVIIGERVAVSDFNLSAFGYKQGFSENRYTFYADNQLLETAKKINIDHVYLGDMVSSDTFINNQDLVNNILVNYDSALCADMEAGSIAMVLNEFNIPFIVIRSISDNVVKSSDNKLDFEAYLQVASKNSAKITHDLISMM